MKIHVVKSGDTLFQLAEKYNIDLATLLKANPQIADPDNIVPGMKIRIPSVAVPVVPPTEATAYQHTVQQGDTLWKLSKAWNIPLQALIAFNPQLKNPNVLLTGETVFIPKSGAESPHQLQQPAAMEMPSEPMQFDAVANLPNIHGSLPMPSNNPEVNVPESNEPEQGFQFADHSGLADMNKKIDDLFAQFKVPSTEASAVHPMEKLPEKSPGLTAPQMLPPVFPPAAPYAYPNYPSDSDCGHQSNPHPAFYPPQYAQPLTNPNYPGVQQPYALPYMPTYTPQYPGPYTPQSTAPYMAYTPGDVPAGIYNYPMPWSSGEGMSDAPHGYAPLALPGEAADGQSGAALSSADASERRGSGNKPHRHGKSADSRSRRSSGKQTKNGSVRKSPAEDPKNTGKSSGNPWMNM